MFLKVSRLRAMREWLKGVWTDNQENGRSNLDGSVLLLENFKNIFIPILYKIVKLAYFAKNSIGSAIIQATLLTRLRSLYILQEQQPFPIVFDGTNQF